MNEDAKRILALAAVWPHPICGIVAGLALYQSGPDLVRKTRAQLSAIVGQPIEVGHSPPLRSDEGNEMMIIAARIC
jgi:hypothetical protein